MRDLETSPDIIDNAKQLLDAATREPWVVYTRSFGVIDAIGPIERDLTEGFDVDSGSAELAAAAPELAQALAEETWEYSVQVKRGGQWQFYIGESRLPTDKPGLANGFSQKNHAQELAKLEVEYPTRIVRRRVSPPEVINE